MQMVARSGFEPAANFSSLVRGIIIQDEVNIKIGSHFAFNLTQKAHKFRFISKVLS